MGYGEAVVGHPFRERLVDDRIDDWRTRPGDDHGLIDEALDTLALDIECVSHHGSRAELVVLALASTPFALVLLGAIVYVPWRRRRRYRLASTIEGHLTGDPRRPRAGDGRRARTRRRRVRLAREPGAAAARSLSLGYRAAKGADYGVPFSTPANR